MWFILRNSHTLSQKAPSTRRCIKTVLYAVRHFGLLQVRKHPAPEGALRRDEPLSLGFYMFIRKYPAPEGALRLEEGVQISSFLVRKPPAPEGALRRSFRRSSVCTRSVRKYPAPEGALRHVPGPVVVDLREGQKAPSTRRCIKTRASPRSCC